VLYTLSAPLSVDGTELYSHEFNALHRATGRTGLARGTTQGKLTEWQVLVQRLPQICSRQHVTAGRWANGDVEMVKADALSRNLPAWCDEDHEHVRFEVFTAVTIKNGIFWDVTPCGSCKN
jgi:hypothetical protein